MGGSNGDGCFIGQTGPCRAISVVASAPIFALFAVILANRAMFCKTELSSGRKISAMESPVRLACGNLPQSSVSGEKWSESGWGILDFPGPSLRVDGGDPGVDMFGRDRTADRQSVVTSIVEVTAGQFAVPGRIHFVTQPLGIGVAENP